MAIATRMRTGITVHATSRTALWVVFDGTGLALALNFTITMMSSARTNRAMMTVIGTSR